MKKVLIIGTGNIAIKHFQNILKLKITNPVYKDLKKLKLIKDDNFFFLFSKN